MVYLFDNISKSTLSNKKPFIALESTLNQSISNLKELVSDFEQLQLESDDYKAQVLSLREKCESKVCVGSEALKKVIQLKDNIIQSVASVLTRLNETKDMKIIDEAFKILCGETMTLTPPKDSDMKLLTPKKEMSPSYTEAFNDESVSEIEATPTGRKSPIILSRKARNAAASDNREKKKCPESWPTPGKKAVKLTYPSLATPHGKTGKGKLRQTRFTTVKQTSVIDITNSLELSSARGSRDSMSCVQLITKKESFDDEDTIEPSPTSITTNFSSIYRSAVRSSPLKHKNSPNKIAKGSPNKLSLNKKPLANVQKLFIKTENATMCNVENVENNIDPELQVKIEESINLLRPAFRFKTPEKSPAKKMDPDETEHNIDSSMSLLLNVKPELASQDKKILFSPTKRPLAENINCTNLQKQCDTQANTSLLNKKQVLDAIVKKDLEKLATKKDNEPGFKAVFKEPTVRKKAEKLALPGWSCDECKNFYAELYKDNPEMLAQKMQECSKHRGRQNPARPRTPPGFWYPRWDVPEDTDEFNRRNNV